MGGHVVLGFAHAPEKGIAHLAFLAVLLLVLFRPAAASFFGGEFRE